MLPQGNSTSRPYSAGPEPRTVSGAMALVPTIFPVKHLILIRQVSSIVLSLRATENTFAGTETKEFFGVVAFDLVISSSKQFCSWRLSSAVHS